MAESMMLRYYAACGGRKVGLGLIATALLTVMAVPLEASFVEYSGGILLALGITTTGVVVEDQQKRKAVAHDG